MVVPSFHSMLAVDLRPLFLVMWSCPLAAGFARNEWSGKKSERTQNKKATVFFITLSQKWQLVILPVCCLLKASYWPTESTTKEKRIKLYFWKMKYQRICGYIYKTTKSSIVYSLHSSHVQNIYPSQGHQNSHPLAASVEKPESYHLNWVQVQIRLRI